MPGIPHPPFEFGAAEEDDYRARLGRNLFHTLATFQDQGAPLLTQLDERYADVHVTPGIIVPGAAVPLAFRLRSSPAFENSKPCAALTADQTVDTSQSVPTENFLLVTLEYATADEVRYQTDEELEWTPYVTAIGDCTAEEITWDIVDQETGVKFDDADIFRAGLVLDRVRGRYIDNETDSLVRMASRENTERVYDSEAEAYGDRLCEDSDEDTVNEVNHQRQGYTDFKSADFIEPSNGACDACLKTGMGCVHTISARQ